LKNDTDFNKAIYHGAVTIMMLFDNMCSWNGYLLVIDIRAAFRLVFLFF